MNYGYIYKTTNLINGRIYIGQTKKTFRHDYIGSGKLIIKAIKKYGRENFRLEVLAYATTKAMLDGLEQKYIYEYRQVFGNDFLYNIANGGNGSLGHTHKHTKEAIEKIKSASNKMWESEDHRKRHSEILKGHKGAWTGKKRDEEFRNKCRKRMTEKPIKHWLGKNHSAITKKKMSESRTGNKNHMTGKHIFYGKRPHEIKQTESLKGK